MVMEKPPGILTNPERFGGKRQEKLPANAGSLIIPWL